MVALVGVEVDHRRRSSRRLTERPAVDDHDGDARSVQHALQPRPRQRRLQRNIRRPCLEHAEHGHDLIRRPVEDEADPDLGAGTARTEVMRQPVRTRVQFGIGQPFRRRRPGPNRRVSRGPGPRTRRGSPMARADRGCPARFRAVRRRLTPRHDLPALSVGEQRQLGQPPFRMSDEVLEHFHVLVREPLDRRGLEQVCVELHRAGEPSGRVLEPQREIELRRTGPLVEIERREGQVERADRRQCVVLEDEHHLEERRTAGITPGPKRGDEDLQRDLLVFECLQGHLAHAGQEFPHGRIPGQVGAERDHVDEVADQFARFPACCGWPPARRRRSRPGRSSGRG